MGMTNNMKNVVLDASLGAGATLLGSTVEIALSTTTIADDGSGITEPSGNGYARVSVTNNGTNWSAASGGIKTNAVDIIFPEATAGWGTISDWALYDSGVMKFHGIVDDGEGTPEPIAVLSEYRVRFTASQLRISLD
jgi:hypothetical protein